MAIAREQLEARLAQLKEGVVQAQANLQVTIGAMQECQFWLEQMDEVEPRGNKPLAAVS